MHRKIIEKIINGLNKDPFLYLSFGIALILFGLNTLDIASKGFLILKNIIFQYYMQTLQLFLLTISLYNLRAKK